LVEIWALFGILSIDDWLELFFAVGKKKMTETESASNNKTGSFRDECSSVESPQLSAEDTLEGSGESVQSSEFVIVGGENNMEPAVSSSSSSHPLCGYVLPDSDSQEQDGLELNRTINNETNKVVEHDGVVFEVEDDSQVESEVHCVVCMDEVPSRQMFTVHCESGHRFCLPCIKRHVTISLGEKKAASCLMCSHQLTQVNLQYFFLLSFFFCTHYTCL
jgi:hypothetical protein